MASDTVWRRPVWRPKARDGTWNSARPAHHASDLPDRGSHYGRHAELQVLTAILGSFRLSTPHVKWDGAASAATGGLDHATIYGRLDADRTFAHSWSFPKTGEHEAHREPRTVQHYRARQATVRHT